ncbi:MAG: SIR2 family protein [Tenericutes bacterium]|nr:SIR2 family protein [Mycoplasmatota bacterium]
MDKIEKEGSVMFNSRILSSAHLNFFFGAGVNGRAIKQMNDLEQTNDLLKEKLGRSTKNFELGLLELEESKRNEVLAKFQEELGKSIDDAQMTHVDIQDIQKMFTNFNALILSSENRTKTMKQVNVYTTNYDNIIENVLNNVGYLCNVISSSNIDGNDKFFELIGYDYSRDVYVPTYLVSKIHGDLKNPILPSKNKYDETLQRKRFEILFRMKSQLSRKNSILFVIGYSGNDEHLNSLINDAISFGLTVYWFKYDNTHIIPETIKNNVIVIEQEDNDNKKNPTLTCSRMVSELWENPSEE